MATRDDGGPAFPTDIDTPNGLNGMSLRDWFAGQALVGLLANTRPGDSTTSAHKSYVRYSAADAYVFADAMLAERSKP